jgi:DNA invertase Pin-like site-specific DNA recombinase
LERQSPPGPFCYCRFSTRATSRDNIPKRQLQRAKEYADRVGLELDAKLTADNGASDLKGTAIEKGSLAHFLNLVRAGKVKPRATLVIENLDRLSRQGPKATRQLIEQVTDSGVDVHILNLRLTLKQGWENKLTDSVILDAELSRSYLESSYRSERIKKAWANRKTKAPEAKA